MRSLRFSCHLTMSRWLPTNTAITWNRCFALLRSNSVEIVVFGYVDLIRHLEIYWTWRGCDDSRRMLIVVTSVLHLSIVWSCKLTTFRRVVVPLSVGGTGKDENPRILMCPLYRNSVNHWPRIFSWYSRVFMSLSDVCILGLACLCSVWCLLSRIFGMACTTFREQLCSLLGWDHFAKYRVRINYWSILQNHIFTNTEQKYTISLPFERGMFAVPLVTTASKLPSERALNRHKTVTSRKFRDTPTTLGRWGSHFSPTLVYIFTARWQWRL
jgi:hypothetical protein